MSNIEDLVRESLRQRAEDVEATPALWREVDRRIVRRRRVQVAVWSVAGATALVAAVLAVPALVERPDPTPEVEPMPPGPIEEPDPSDDGGTPEGDSAESPDGAEDGQAPQPGSDGAVVGDVTLAEPVLVATRTRIELIGPEGRELVYEFDAEGESSVMGLAVRPGSTPSDLTFVALTTAEGTWDLRHYQVTDGELVIEEAFPPQYRPGTRTGPGAGFTVSGPVWAPDGDALAWVEGTPEELGLTLVGWSDGPGTGETATDNARFGLDMEAASGAAVGRFPLLHEWHWTDATAGSSAIVTTLDEPTAAAWYIPVEQQGDRAWALPSAGPSGGIGTDVGPSEDGFTYAVGGVFDDGSPRWMVRLEADGPVLLEGPFGDGRAARSTALPGDLFPGESFPQLWVRAMGDGAMIGSQSTSVAYYLDGDGALARVPGEVAFASPIR